MKKILKYSETSEKSIEKYLVSRVREIGGLCLKYTNPFMVGYPDRLVLLPGGWVRWVELKSKGKKPSKIQQLRHAELKVMGHEVCVVDSKDEIDVLIDYWKMLL